MKYKILLLFITLNISSLYGQQLRDGDLLFVGSGSSGMSDAIVSATVRTLTDDYTHVAIYFTDEEQHPMVIEASPECGVAISTFESFLERCPHKEGKPAVTAKRLSEEFSIEGVIQRAKDLLGQPYDWWYLPDNDKIYCSELIYESYLDNGGNHIFKTVPMNFNDENGQIHPFWQNLYDSLGVDVPQGEPGTNPAEMSLDPRLTEVYRFF